MPGEKFLDGRQSHKVIKIGRATTYANPVATNEELKEPVQKGKMIGRTIPAKREAYGAKSQLLAETRKGCAVKGNEQPSSPADLAQLRTINEAKPLKLSVRNDTYAAMARTTTPESNAAASISFVPSSEAGEGRPCSENSNTHEFIQGIHPFPPPHRGKDQPEPSPMMERFLHTDATASTVSSLRAPSASPSDQSTGRMPVTLFGASLLITIFNYLLIVICE
jgi:hypothetical protein